MDSGKKAAYKKYIQEIEKVIRAVPANQRTDDVSFLKKYIGTQYNLIGLKVPPQRVIYKKGYSFFSLKPAVQIEIWDSIWQQSNCHEVMTQAIFFWEKNIANTDAAVAWQYLKSWVSKIDNWPHSDSLSGFYSYLLESKPSMVLPQFKKWNKSKKPWERRQTLVGLVHYHSKRKEVLPFETMIPFVENLLDDKDYFVQKGVGWALREIGHAYPKKTFAFLKKHYAHITGIAFAAASEKVSTQQKEELKKLRKEARKKN